MTILDNEFIIKTFKSVKHIEQQRYRRGLSLRQVIMNQNANGQEMDGYRIEFLKDSIFKLFKFLEELGTEFNKAHPDDYFTSSDLGDILVNSISILENKVSN